MLILSHNFLNENIRLILCKKITIFARLKLCNIEFEF
jgi:hypothetical protein